MNINCTKNKRYDFNNNFTGPTQAQLPAKNYLDMAYGTHPRQRLDIYLPAGRTVFYTKILILIHGGEWSKGDKSQMEYFINNLSKDLKDFAFATVNYRYVSGRSNLFPTQEEDILNAIHFITSHTDSFAISKKNALFGESAGGHLALLQAYKYKSSHTRAVIALNAPSDLTEMYQNPINALNRSLLETVTGTTPGTSSIFANSSPVNYVSNSSPATLLFHATDDGFIDVKQSVQLSAKLSTAAVTNDLQLLQGEKHVLSNMAYQEIFSKTILFLKQPLLFR